MGHKVTQAAIAGGVAAVAWRVMDASAGHEDWWMLVIGVAVFVLALLAERHIV